jgi:hypothetical protein
MAKDLKIFHKKRQEEIMHALLTNRKQGKFTKYQWITLFSQRRNHRKKYSISDYEFMKTKSS